MMQTILNQADIRRILPVREEESHKGDYGKLLLLCGSRGYTGAAYFSAMGALRVGAGLVFLGVPESIYTIEAVKLNEPIVFPLPDSAGMLSTASIPEILDRITRMDAVLIGPGIGQSTGTLAVVTAVMEKAKCPVVLDADGINLLAAHKDIIRNRSADTILTPHDGEFARLYPFHTGTKQELAQMAARDLGTVILLKGHHTIITDGQTVFCNKTGNPGMAVGGSGDVLAGMITGLLGQGIPPLEAAAAGAWLHGAAGDYCAKNLGQYAMLPSDMLNALPKILNRSDAHAKSCRRCNHFLMHQRVLLKKQRRKTNLIIQKTIAIL